MTGWKEILATFDLINEKVIIRTDILIIIIFKLSFSNIFALRS